MVARQSSCTRAIGIFAASITAVLATGRAASARQRPADNAPADARQSIAIAGDMELSRLVELTSAAVSASIEYQALELSKRVTLRLREAMTPIELWDAMAATLEANGVVLIDTGKPGLFKALPTAQAPQAARVLPVCSVLALPAMRGSSSTRPDAPSPWRLQLPSPSA